MVDRWSSLRSRQTTSVDTSEPANLMVTPRINLRVSHLAPLLFVEVQMQNPNQLGDTVGTPV